MRRPLARAVVTIHSVPLPAATQFNDSAMCGSSFFMGIPGCNESLVHDVVSRSNKAQYPVPSEGNYD
jgi:hypothetical protein